MLSSASQKTFLAVLVFSAAWGNATTVFGTHLEAVQAELDSHRQIWQVLQIDEYTYRMQRICECLESYTNPGIVHVADGQITSVAHAVTGDALDPEIFLTIEELFAEIQNGIDEHAATVAAVYDPVIGYPTAFDIDLVLQIADEEVIFRAGNLVVVPEPHCGILLLWAFASLAFRKSRRANC